MVSAPITLRQRSGTIITVIVWAFLALLLLDAIVRGSWDTVGKFLPTFLLIGWLVFVVLWRPAVIVDDDSVVIREIFRTTTVPFAQITDIRLSTVVAIMTAAPNGGSRTYRPWNAPGMPRRKIDSGLTGGMRPEAVEHHPAFELLQRWETSEARPITSGGNSIAPDFKRSEPTSTVWDRGVLGVSLVLVLLVVIGLL